MDTQRNKEKDADDQLRFAHYDYCKNKMNLINRYSALAFVFTCAMEIGNVSMAMFTAYTYSEAYAPKNGFLVGVAQILIGLFVFVPTFFVLMKSKLSCFITIAFYFLLFVSGFFGKSGIQILIGGLGAFIYIQNFLYFVQLDKIKEMEGYPHFNERLSNTTNEYAPDYYVAPEDRKDDMDALTEEEQKQYDEMLEKGLSAAFAAKYPQMDEITAEAIGDEEKIAEPPLASREEKEEHAKKILDKQKKSFSQKYKAFSDPNFNKIIEKQKKEKEEKLKSTGIQDISQDIQNNNNKQ